MEELRYIFFVRKSPNIFHFLIAEEYFMYDHQFINTNLPINMIKNRNYQPLQLIP